MFSQTRKKIGYITVMGLSLLKLILKVLTNLSGSYSFFCLFVLKTDVHYSILSLLLCLSDSPSNSNYVEIPRDKEVGTLSDTVIYNKEIIFMLNWFFINFVKIYETKIFLLHCIQLQFFI